MIASPAFQRLIPLSLVVVSLQISYILSDGTDFFLIFLDDTEYGAAQRRDGSLRLYHARSQRYQKWLRNDIMPWQNVITQRGGDPTRRSPKTVLCITIPKVLAAVRATPSHRHRQDLYDCPQSLKSCHISMEFSWSTRRKSRVDQSISTERIYNWSLWWPRSLFIRLSVRLPHF